VDRASRRLAATSLLALVGFMAFAAASPPRRVMPQDLPLSSVGPDSFVATFETTRGNVVMRARRATSPLGVDRLYHLVHGGYYDGLVIYRVGTTKTVVGGRVVQFGTSGDTAVSHAWEKATLDDEPVIGTHRPGAVSFARGAPRTRSVEIAINTNDAAPLDTVRYEGVVGFPIVAQVVSGLDVLARLNGRYGNAPIENDSLTILGGGYLDRAFPGLDRIKRARITKAWPPEKSSK
jgi:cyclophilin family peptidyl-prolyl cis-trans isomerase